MTPAELVPPLLAWFAREARDLPWRHTHDPYAIWVSEIMLQQTQVATVIPYWQRWMRALPDLTSLAAADPERVLKLWEGLGYYSRARNLQRAARELVEHHDGRFPTTFVAVLALPGIGRYTAGAICSLAFNQPTPALDGNVARVLARVSGVRENVTDPAIREALWRMATDLVGLAATVPAPGEGSAGRPHTRRLGTHPCGAFNEALMELGALVCTPQKPRCGVCPWAGHCGAHAAGLTEVIPRLPPRPATRARRVLAFFCQRSGRVLVRQRPAGSVNGGLWELPNVEARPRTSPFEAARALLGPAVARVEPAFALRHAITVHRIRLEIHHVGLGAGAIPRSAGTWRSRAALESLPFTAAHRRALNRLGGETVD